MRTGKLLTRGLLVLTPFAIALLVLAQAPGRLALTAPRAPEAARALAAAPPASTPALAITADPEARDLVIEVGPVDLPANGDHRQLPALHTTLPVDGWLHGYRIELVDGQGRPVPRRLLHHINVIAPGQRELFSPIMLRVAAAGQETAPVNLPRLLGYRFRQGQELIVTAMLHNATAQDYRGVRLRAHFPYTPSTALVRPVSVVPFYMDVMPPASLHSYDLPAGRSSRSWYARPAVDGRILGVSGHLHQYGTALRLEDVTAHRVLWQARPELGPGGDVVRIPQGRLYRKLGVAIERGHYYRLTAEYDNTSGAMIPGGGMGALGGIFVPDRAEAWPPVDRNDPQMKLDWRLVHTGNQDGHGGGHHHGGAAPAAMPGMDHGSMSGMEHGSMPAMDHASMPGMSHDHPAATAAAPAQTSGHMHMPGMEHSHRR